MRVNSRVYSEKQDMTGFIQIPNCPEQFRKEAENLINMVSFDYPIGKYNTMTELDKNLIFDYWQKYDGLVFEQDIEQQRRWFVEKATSPELIRRARQFLVERNYLLIDEDVLQRASQAGKKFSQSVKVK